MENNNNTNIIKNNNSNSNIQNNINNNIPSHNMNMSEIKSFISSKEGEIKAILLQKISLLENELSTYIQKNKNLQTSLDKLKEAYKTNLKVIEERDNDLKSYEDKFDSISAVINNKENEIIKLKNEKNIFNLIEYENNNLLDESSISKISQLNDNEKIEVYKKKIEEYKERLKANELQLQMLRNEIKDLRNENEKIKSFDGKINSYDDFLSLFNIAFDNYKPKKKEQEEAFKKIKVHLNEGNNNNGNKINKKKKGFMGMFK